MAVHIVDTNTSTTDQYDDETVAMFRKALASNYEGLDTRIDSAYMAEIDKFLKSDTVLLDIGCGNGDILMAEICKTTTPKFSNSPFRPKEIFAVDNSASGLEAFRKQLEPVVQQEENFPEIHLLKGDMRRIGDFGIPKCDLIISRFTLNYLQSLDDIKHCLQQVKGLLKPDGHLVFSLGVCEPVEHPSTKYAYSLLSRGNSVPVILPPGVKVTVHGHSSSDIMHAFHAAGLTVTSMILLGGYGSIIADKYHDGEPYPKDKFPYFTTVISCVH